MIQNFRWPSAPIVCLLAFMLSCGKPTPVLQGIDTAEWKADKDGCDGKRTTMITAIRNEKNKLLGLEELVVIKLLGKPDENALYKRNQKFYNYFLEPSSPCAGAVESPQKLSIRFNAMGLAKEVAVE